jgi:DNA-binding winged helix-turn-helix (wHTH) protein/Tol biopolymer transport system component
MKLGPKEFEEDEEKSLKLVPERLNPERPLPSIQRKEHYEFAEFRLDETERRLMRGDKTVPLTPKVCDTLLYLVQNAGRIIEKDEFLNALWPGTFVEEANLAVNVSTLRKALGEAPDSNRYIETIPRRGYRFVAEVRRVDEQPREARAANTTFSRESAAAASGAWVLEEPITDGTAMGGSEVEPAGMAVAKGRRSRLAAFNIVVVFVAGIAIGSWVSRYFESVPSFPAVESTIKLQPGYWLDGMRAPRELGLERPTRNALVLSHDGRFLVYSAVPENSPSGFVPGTLRLRPDPEFGRPPMPSAKPRLYLRRLDRIEAKPIAGTEGGVGPFLSPDDRWVAFWVDGVLMKVPIDGDVPPVPLCDAHRLGVRSSAGPFGADWGADGRIVLAAAQNVGLTVVPAEGGEPERLTIPDSSRGEWSHRLPHWLPAGKGILFTIMENGYSLESKVAVWEPAAPRWRYLLEEAADARYLPSGHLVFLHRGALMAARFDLARFEIIGQPVPVIASVMQALNVYHQLFNTGAGQISTSDTGSLVYVPGGIFPEQENQLVWVDRGGLVEPVIPEKAAFGSISLSPDGKRIAYLTTGKERGLWTYEIDRGVRALVTEGSVFPPPIWTPDSKAVVFGWSEAGELNLYRQAIDGTTPKERLTTSEYSHRPASWSRDGSSLLFVEIRPESGGDIGLLDLRTGRTAPLLNSPANEAWPYLSPDGRWLVYTSDESKRPEVYVRSFPDAVGRVQISTQGGTDPAWSRDGKELFYRVSDEWWVVDVRTESGFSPSKPRLLFERPGILAGGPNRTWDVAPDGRFLMTALGQGKVEPVTEMILAQNWFEELRRQVKTEK